MVKIIKSKELGVIFDLTVEDGDEEISVMDHGVTISIGHEGPFDVHHKKDNLIFV